MTEVQIVDINNIEITPKMIEAQDALRDIVGDFYGLSVEDLNGPQGFIHATYFLLSGVMAHLSAYIGDESAKNCVIEMAKGMAENIKKNKTLN
jgi:hypothetical protein